MKYSDISSKLIVRQYVIILYLLFPFIINGQLIIKPIDGQDVTPEKIIEDIFLGQGVEIININYEGLDVAAGIFENGSDYIGLDKGFILSTGDVRSASENASVEADGGFGQDDVMDEDLEELANINIRDVVKYEITFIPISDTLRFNYVFAYEDINLACLSTNDAFGFFIKGPNPDGGNYDNKNIALIPDPDNPGQFLDIPVSINTVNNGIAPDPETEVCFLDYSDYFNETDPNSPPVYDGYLDIFPAEVSVIPCEEYTIKIVLGDGKDDQGDSAVFLEEKSFSTNFLTVKNNNPGLNGGISEGCQAGNIELIINGARNINYQISLRALDDISLPDIALPGIDYEDIPENISIPPGQNSVELPLVALPDGLIEDTEFIYLEVSTGICNIDTLIFPITENTLSSLSLSDSLHNCFNDRDTIFASIDDLTDNDIRSFQSPQSFIINNNQEVISPIVVSGIEEEKLSPNLITNICIDQLYHTRLNDLDIFLQAPGGQILELSTRNGNRVNNESQIDTFINTCFNVSASDLINNGNSILGEMDLSNPTYTGQYTPEGDFDSWLSTESPSNGTYNLIVRDPINEFSGELTSWSISFMLDYEVTYNWFPTNGAQNCNCDSLIFQLGNSQYYYLEVTDTYGCANRDSVWVEVDPLPQTPDIINCESTSTSQVTFSWDQTPDFYEYQIRINDDPTWITTNSFVELLNGYKVNIK